MPDSFEIKNAIVRDIRIVSERGFILTVWVDLDYGNSGQGFGGWSLGATDETSKIATTADTTPNICGVFIGRLMRVLDVEDLMKGIGKTVRADASHSKVRRVGHIVRDIWLDPKAEFDRLQGIT